MRRRARIAVAVVVLMTLGAACRPSAESNPMPAVVRAESDDGWTVRVPVCDDDGIGRFDLSDGSPATESRWSRDSGPRRLVDLVVTPQTLRTGAFNPSEVKVLARQGKLRDPLVDGCGVFGSILG